MGFHMAGGRRGADAIGSEQICCDATVLDDRLVGAVPYSNLTCLGVVRQWLRRTLQRAMSAEIVRKHKIWLLLGSNSGGQRLAAF
jgi:hypothetical protein